MIELKEEQLQAINGQQEPPIVVDPQTGQEYLLIKREIYDKMRAFLKPFARAWDNPADDDLTRKPS